MHARPLSGHVGCRTSGGKSGPRIGPRISRLRTFDGAHVRWHARKKLRPDTSVITQPSQLGDEDGIKTEKLKGVRKRSNKKEYAGLMTGEGGGGGG